MKAGDDESFGLTALTVVPEVPEEVCEDTDEYEDLFEGYQSKSDDEYCSDSGDEISDAKLARVVKSNPFKQLIYKGKEARSKWIAGKFQTLVKSNPGIQAGVISDLLRDQFNVVVDTQRMYKAKRRALQVLVKEH
ncbi:hypothetical protein Q3G72_002964 [Acer saccharum]|nr:hypothetical protein Q3G72_002964 [Acer saccharum]